MSCIKKLTKRENVTQLKKLCNLTPSLLEKIKKDPLPERSSLVWHLILISVSNQKKEHAIHFLLSENGIEPYNKYDMYG